MKYFTLSNGLEIPAVGTGTNSFAKKAGNMANVYTGSTEDIRSALKAGYVLIDTAESYKNEEAIGSGIRESGIDRKKLFITTKMKTKSNVPVSLKRADAIAAVERSLKKLQTDYIDLYLIHFPWKNIYEVAEVWSVFEEMYDKGILKSIGVSNFMPENLDALLGMCRIKPMANQIKITPDVPNDETCAYCQERGILPIGYGPLKFSDEKKVVLTKIGGKYGKTWAQTVLRYNFQNGVVSIPKSHSFEHQKANLDIFDFELTSDEMEKIKTGK